MKLVIVGMGGGKPPVVVARMVPPTYPARRSRGRRFARFYLLILDDVEIAAAPVKGFAESDREAWAEGTV